MLSAVCYRNASIGGPYVQGRTWPVVEGYVSPAHSFIAQAEIYTAVGCSQAKRTGSVRWDA